MLVRNLLTACLLSISSSSVLHARGIRLHPRQSEEANGSAFVNVNITLDNDLMGNTSAAVEGRSSLAGFVSLNLTGVWTASTSYHQDYAYGGSYLWTRDPEAKAEFKFNGSSVYYMSPRFSTLPTFTFMTEVQLDNFPRALVNLGSSDSPDAGTIRPTNTSTVLWSRSGLNITQEHTLTISMAQGAQYAILDALVYTTFLPPNDPRLPSATGDVDDPSPASSSSSSSPLSKSVRITIITLCSVLLAIFVYIAFRYVQTRRNRASGRDSPMAEAVRRWVDMRWVNASRTNLPGAGQAGVGGEGAQPAHWPSDVKDPMEMKKVEQV
ncbi:hypothetical protein ONZ45_g10571 [Pleurotus djamor]|nr:hypothetical protein ONZ45_g10571 [Pleurotus djamor]